jgi:hypothetical protein
VRFSHSSASVTDQIRIKSSTAAAIPSDCGITTTQRVRSSFKISVMQPDIGCVGGHPYPDRRTANPDILLILRNPLNPVLLHAAGSLLVDGHGAATVVPGADIRAGAFAHPTRLVTERRQFTFIVQLHRNSQGIYPAKKLFLASHHMTNN